MKRKSIAVDNELKKLEISDKEIAIRDKALQELQSLEKKRNELKAKVELMKDCDPQVFTQMENDCQVSKEAINRWTGYLFLKLSLIDIIFSNELKQILDKLFN